MFWRKTNKIVPIIFIKPENIIEQNHCPICLNNLKNNVTLPCGHSYHSECILNWIEKNNTCPICRIKLNWTRVD